MHGQCEYLIDLVGGGYFVSPVLPRIDDQTGEMVVQQGEASPIAFFPPSLWAGLRRIEVHDAPVRPAHAADPAPTMVLGDPAEVQSVAQGAVL